MKTLLRFAPVLALLLGALLPALAQAAAPGIPAVTVTEPAESELTIVRKDGTIAHTLKFNMIPAVEVVAAAP